LFGSYELTTATVVVVVVVAGESLAIVADLAASEADEILVKPVNTMKLILPIVPELWHM